MDRKMITQIVMLVVLLGGLAASTMFMISKIRGPRRQVEPSTSAATDQTTQPATAAGQANGATAVASADADNAMNQNLFKVYDLDAERNPFVQEQEWYGELLNEIPGFPELADNNYFDSMEGYFPDTESIFGEDAEFGEIALTRSEMANIYNMSGLSEDGTINTSLTFTEPTAEQVKLTWDAAGMSQRTREGGSTVSASGEIIQADPFETDPRLPTPYGDPFALTRNGVAQGDDIACLGVSLQGRSYSALIYLNDQPFIASRGTILAPNYRVDTITEDGVLLVDLRDGSTEWIELNGQNADPGPPGGLY